MKNYILIILLFSFSAIAENEWPNTSGMYAAQKSNEEYLKHKQELPSLMEALSKELIVNYYKSAVERYMKTWEIYINSACSLVGISTGGSNGWPAYYANNCKIKLIVDKKHNIQKSINCIQDLTRDRLSEGSAERMACLINTLGVTIK
jgi:hypothetical protein